MRSLLRFVRELLLENGWLKLTSVLIAIALWLMVRGSPGEQMINVPLTVQIPRNMVIINERPSLVEITTQGYVANIAGSTPNLTYNIDLQSAEEGEHMIPLSPAGVRGNRAYGLSVIRVNPARISLVLERMISKDVPVRVPASGTPAPGLDLYQVTCVPSIVSISGPRSNINSLKEVETDPVSIAARSASFHAIVNFNVRDVDIHVSPVGPAEVDVSLGPHREVRTLRIPAVAREGDAFVVNPPFITVSVLVPENYRGKITSGDLRVTASAPNPGPTSNHIAVVPEVEFVRELGPGITIKQVNPEQVTLIRKARKK